MGTPEFAVTSLRRLVEEGYRIVGVVTTPDKPAGRGQKLHESDVKRYAVQAGLPVLQPVKLKDPEFVEAFRALKADLAIVIAFRMLPEVIWSMPRLGTFNLHASLLPQYRGAAPINWALINGERQSGVTTFLLNSEIDKGNIIGQIATDIAPDENVGQLYDRLMHIGSGLVCETVEKLAEGRVEPVIQSHIPDHELKPAPKIFKEDCRIDWHAEGKRIVDFVRGLSPYPAAWSSLRDDRGAEINTLKIFKTSFVQAPRPAPAGSIQTDGKSYVKVACKDGWIFIDELQMAGKKRMPVKELLLGLKTLGDHTLA
ncbi:MAG: methionyl-tRNA formyltransferase [Rikenellaceae bacterium]|nr:methionyl-tRNA formyltransferase [Rikenellaceae bacterium]